MSPTTSSNPKAVFYEAALSDALTAGAWADATPSKSLKAEAISWGELERKLAKHTGDSIGLSSLLKSGLSEMGRGGGTGARLFRRQEMETFRRGPASARPRSTLGHLVLALIT